MTATLSRRDITDTSTTATSEPGRLTYQPVLDGLRAIAVAAVVAYHLGYRWAKGGFLGVDTFFVLSGYLITSLLLDEWSRARVVRLGAFWARRARRLLPALFVLLLGVAIAGVTIVPAIELGRLRGDALAGFFYVANWRFVLSGQSYFDLFSSPSPLRHLWSLAIEEQFYVVWPLIVLACLRLARRGERALAVVCTVGIVASVVTMAFVYVPGDPSRAYYGTDARAHTLLVGCLLAVVLRSWSPRSRRAAMSVRGAGAVALGGVVLCFALVSDTGSKLYHGGSLAFAVLVVPIIVCSATLTSSEVHRMLSPRPLRWLGRVSYGVYLWHWPMIVWLTPHRTGLDGAALDVVRVAATLALAAASFRLVERPIRTARFSTRRRRALVPIVAGTVALALIGATAGAEALPSYYADAGVAAAPCHPRPDEVRTARAAVAAMPPAAVPRGYHRVLLVGDSIACSLFPSLAASGARVGVHVTDGTVVACGVVGDHFNAFTHVTSPCHSLVVQVEQRAFTTGRPDLVVWSSEWERWQQVRDGKVLDPGTPGWRKALLSDMTAALDRLTAGGAHVLLVTQPPPATILNYATGGSVAATVAGAIPYFRLNSVLRELAREHRDRVTLVDLAAELCPTGYRCPDRRDGIRLRWDGVHFSPAGAAWVARWLLGQVAGTSQPPPTQSAPVDALATVSRFQSAGESCTPLPVTKRPSTLDPLVAVSCRGKSGGVVLRVFADRTATSAFLKFESAFACRSARASGTAVVHLAHGTAWVAGGDAAAVQTAITVLHGVAVDVRC